jgi:colanic acid/amylovoran biosynthesis glycosyltransferase
VPKKLTGVALSRFLLTSSPGAFVPLVREHRSELIHAHFSVDALYALPLARRLGCPLIVTLHGFDVTTTRKYLLRSGRPAWIRYALLQDTLKQSNACFICVSQFIYNVALRSGFPEKQLLLHYIGIDTTQFESYAPGASPRLVHVARLVPKKGTRFLIDAVAQVCRKFRDLSLDIIGDGMLRRNLEAQVQHLGIERNVRFHGTQPHTIVRELLRGATAFVLPSITAESGDAEGLGLVLLEASASGVPVIGTRHGGIPEVVRENESGLLVPEGDTNALADAIATIVSDAGLQARMGKVGRKVACDKFDIYKQSAELEAFYRRICR